MKLRIRLHLGLEVCLLADVGIHSESIANRMVDANVVYSLKRGSDPVIFAVHCPADRAARNAEGKYVVVNLLPLLSSAQIETLMLLIARRHDEQDSSTKSTDSELPT